MEPRPSTPLLASAPADRAGSADSGLITGSGSGADESADQVDHAVDVRIGEVGEQWQRDLLLVVVLGDRAHARLATQVSVDGMPVDRQVVDLHADIVRPEVLEEGASATVADPERVEVPHRVCSCSACWQPQLVDTRQALVVPVRDCGAASLEGGQSQQLAGAQNTENIRKAVVEPELVDLLVPGPLVGEAQDRRIADQPDAAVGAGTLNRGAQQAYDGAPLGGGEVLGREERER